METTMVISLPVTKANKRSPQAKRRLGQVYALLLQLEDKAPNAQAARPDASGAEDVPTGKSERGHSVT
jgi:hypothetical protein